VWGLSLPRGFSVDARPSDPDREEGLKLESEKRSSSSAILVSPGFGKSLAFRWALASVTRFAANSASASESSEGGPLCLFARDDEALVALGLRIELGRMRFLGLPI
jgi:hypothetical protein